MNYKTKYLKYKFKYLKLKGGDDSKEENKPPMEDGEEEEKCLECDNYNETTIEEIMQGEKK